MARTEEQDLQMSEKIGEAGDNQNLEYATPVPKLESGLADDPDAIIEEEPELHSRTYLAVIALFFLNFVQVYALTGPPAILAYIGISLNGTVEQNWVPNALSMMQAIIGPLVSFASDTFQARKILLVVTCALSFVGAAVAPNVKNIYGLIGATILIGMGFAAVPLAYCIPSEILPRRWRPMAQSLMNIAASLAAITAPLVAGAFTRNSPATGYKNFYWTMMAFWGATVAAIMFGYKPPKRHTRLDGLSIWEKLGRLDLPGCGLLTAGLTLLLVGLSLGDNPWSWTNPRVLATLIAGIVLLVVFGVYEWRFTKIGILHHDLFSNGAARTFGLCIGLIFIEGIMLFTIIVFYPALTSALFEEDPFLVAARGVPFWVCSGASTIPYGFVSSKYRTVRSPLAVGFALFTGALIGMSTVQPGQSTKIIILDGMAGAGFGAPLILIISAVQLATPHHLIATATAVVTSSRAIAAAAFTAIYGAALTSGLAKKMGPYIAEAAIKAGLPAESVPAFVGAIASKDTAAIPTIAGITPEIIGAGVAAAQQALADSFRTIYIIAAPFGALAVVGCFFLGDLSKTMHYRVDAPMEELHSKHKKAAAGSDA